jgi:hypothetical protein
MVVLYQIQICCFEIVQMTVILLFRVEDKTTVVSLNFSLLIQT